MDIGIQKTMIAPQISFLPLNGKEVICAFELAKMTIDVVSEIGCALITFAKELEIIPNVGLEELGSRVIQALEAGIRPENYSSTIEWIEVLLQDDWGYTPEINDKYSHVEKVFMGVGAVAAFLMDRFEQLPVKEFLLAAPSTIGLFTQDRFLYLAHLAMNNSDEFEAVIKYISGNDKSRDTIDRAIDSLMEIERNITPELNDNELYRRVALY